MNKCFGKLVLFMSCVLMLASSALEAMSVNNTHWKVAPWEWVIRSANYGFWRSDIGNFHLSSMEKPLHIMGSCRNVSAADPQALFNELRPVDQHLGPYLTPYFTVGSVVRILNEGYVYIERSKDVFIHRDHHAVVNTSPKGLHSKKVVFEVIHPTGEIDIVTTVFSVLKYTCFTTWGYTNSISCPKKDYPKYEQEINETLSKLMIEQ